MRYLVFDTLTAATAKSKSLAAAMGYPNGDDTYEPAVFEHPNNGKGAVRILLQDWSWTDNALIDPITLLSSSEASGMEEQPALESDGWVFNG